MGNDEIKSRIESVGIYLPPKLISSSETLRGCKTKIPLLLERVTGVQFRHTVGEDEFSIDLAARAMTDCFAMSERSPDEIDLLVSPRLRFSS
jgi:3-oxoacyl-[acyl-carrier-protein] synthase III